MHWPTILNLNRIAEFIRGNEQQEIGSAIEVLDKKTQEQGEETRKKPRVK